MPATRFEFERRFFIIGGIYAIGFFLSAFARLVQRRRYAICWRHRLRPGAGLQLTCAVMTTGERLFFRVFYVLKNLSNDHPFRGC